MADRPEDVSPAGDDPLLSFSRFSFFLSLFLSFFLSFFDFPSKRRKIRRNPLKGLAHSTRGSGRTTLAIFLPGFIYRVSLVHLLFLQSSAEFYLVLPSFA